MQRSKPCAHMRPDYDRLEEAHHVVRHPITDEVSWPATAMEEVLFKLGLINRKEGTQ